VLLVSRNIPLYTCTYVYFIHLYMSACVCECWSIFILPPAFFAYLCTLHWLLVLPSDFRLRRHFALRPNSSSCCCCCCLSVIDACLPLSPCVCVCVYVLVYVHFLAFYILSIAYICMYGCASRCVCVCSPDKWFVFSCFFTLCTVLCSGHLYPFPSLPVPLSTSIYVYLLYIVYVSFCIRSICRLWPIKRNPLPTFELKNRAAKRQFVFRINEFNN